jgi:DNA-binding MarR family transcriptional regulator
MPAMTPVHPDTDTAADLAGRLRFGVTRLARLLRQQSDAGLSPTQRAALATIARCGPMPIGALAEEEQVGPPAATKVVDKLHAAGLVQRLDDPEDRRVKRVGATENGHDLLAELRARKTAWLSTRLAELTPADRHTLTDAVEILERLTARTADTTETSS